MPRPDRLFDWRLAARRQGSASEPWGASASPARLRLVLGGFFAALAAIFVRAAQLESVEGDAFREAAGRLGEQVDVLPARRGRIVSRHGEPLAIDAQALGLEVRYRWIEQPPNSAWPAPPSPRAALGRRATAPGARGRGPASDHRRARSPCRAACPTVWAHRFAVASPRGANPSASRDHCRASQQRAR